MDKGTAPPLKPIHFYLKQTARNAIIGGFVLFISLGLGMIGYHSFEEMSWTDAYLNAAMILSGMGPTSILKTEAGKIFAGSYALFSGTIFLLVIATITAPLLHRFLHKLHIQITR